MPTVSMVQLQQQMADLQRQIVEAEQARHECLKEDEPLLCLRASAQEIARLQLQLNVTQQEMDALSRIAGIWNIDADPVEYSAELLISAWDPQTLDLAASLRQRGHTTDSSISFTNFSPGNGAVTVQAPQGPDAALIWQGTLNPTQPVMAGTVEGVNPQPTWTAARQTTIFIHPPPHL